MQKSLRMAAMTALLGMAVGARPAAAQFGFRGGANLSKFVGGDTDSDSKTKLKLGLTIPMFHVGPLALVPEVYYAQRGATAPTSEFDCGTDTPGGPAPSLCEFSMDYIEVPVLAKLSFGLPGAGMLRPYVAAGPVFAWQLKCEYSLAGAGTTGDCKDPQLSSARAAMKSAEQGIAGAAGVDLRVGSLGAVNLDLRVIRGLSRLTESADGPDVKNQSVSLMLGYSVMR